MSDDSRTRTIKQGSNDPCRRSPFSKLVITIAVIVTFPLWFFPAALALVVWGIHDAIWNSENDPL